MIFCRGKGKGSCYRCIILAAKRVHFFHTRGLLPPLSRSPLLPEEGLAKLARFLISVCKKGTTPEGVVPKIFT